MLYGVVYIITNLENDKCYIGRTKQALHKRWHAHCLPTSNCTYLKHAIKKYGKESFKIEAIASSWDAENLKELEALLIIQENTIVPNGYNLINTCGGISEVSDVTRKKLSDRGKGKCKSEEHRRRISQGRKGIIFSEEHRKNISLAQKGRIGSPTSGTVLSEAAKENLRNINKGKKLSQETKNKISAGLKLNAARRRQIYIEQNK